MLFTILDDSIEFYATSPIFIGCLDGGCEEKKHNARYSQQLKTGTGQRASLRTVPPPRDRLPQEDKVSWYYGGLSRTISIVSVPPLQCFVPNA